MRNDINKPVLYPGLRQMGTDPTLPQVGQAASEVTDTSNTGLFANLMGKLDIGFGSVTSELQKTRKALSRPVAPVIGRLAIPLPLSAGGFGIARLGGPDQGHYWYMRSIQIGGTNDPSVAAPGRADIYVSAMDLRMFTSLAQMGIADWRDMATVLPNVASYANGELSLRLNEELFVAVSNGTANAIYTVGCNYFDFQESDYAGEWSV